MDLIKNAAEIICNSVNVFLENIERRPIPWVVLTSIVDHDGSLNPSIKDTVSMTIYNITRENFAGSYQAVGTAPKSMSADAGLPIKSPPIYIDLHIMFMANFTEKSYTDGLSALSRVISFFQQTPTFTQQNAPGLEPEITQLTLDLENLDPVDVNYVMGMLGTRYLPSAFYKVRMIPFASGAMQGRTYPVTAPGTDMGRAVS